MSEPSTREVLERAYLNFDQIRPLEPGGEGEEFHVALDDRSVAEWREIRITPERYHLLLYLRSLIRQEGVSPGRTIFSVTGLPETIAASHESSPAKQPAPVVNALNIRREFIPNNNLSVILWVDEKTRQRLPYDAKDFWAFCLETRLFHDEAARRKALLAPPPSSPLDEEIADLRDLRDRYRRQRPDDYGAIGQVAYDLGGRGHDIVYRI